MTREHVPIGGDVELEEYIEAHGGGGAISTTTHEAALEGFAPTEVLYDFGAAHVAQPISFSVELTAFDPDTIPPEQFQVNFVLFETGQDLAAWKDVTSDVFGPGGDVNLSTVGDGYELLTVAGRYLHVSFAIYAPEGFEAAEATATVLTTALGPAATVT